MGPFLSNHLALIKDCYPVKTLTTTSIAELKPDGNALSKLCFYSAGRPKKLPKVAAAVLERAERDTRTSGIKARAGLAVTVDIARGLVSECRSELHCFAEDALKVAELALGRREAGARDPDLEARGASLFHAVSVFSSGPSVGLDQGIVKQYLRCLSILSSMAQLGADSTTSRWIALSALEGAVTSEFLYAAAADYESQIRLIIPATLHNCVGIPVPDLRQKFSMSDPSGQTPNLGAVPARKSPIISA
ncbi:protein EFR3, partial [Phenoliferia sp. Uapishka_3]